jgi:hypothetical protein
MKIMAFSANGIGRPSYEVRKPLEDIEIDVAFSEVPEALCEVLRYKLGYISD